MSNQPPHVDDLQPLTSADEACLEAIREVLERHGRLNRFGINLLHQHFVVHDDEILVETCDEENRTLIIKPVKTSELENQPLIETNWNLRTGEPMLSCIQVCAKSAETGQHNKVHIKASGPH